jgi:hypothetical protein
VELTDGLTEGTGKLMSESSEEENGDNVAEDVMDVMDG